MTTGYISSGYIVYSDSSRRIPKGTKRTGNPRVPKKAEKIHGTNGDNKDVNTSPTTEAHNEEQ